ncbi:ankyrin repeat-containing domain protein [Pavlovales sp. CCMP2436]|nr:ankyrin repeat-containing domain protein [Pavlovales sp. CCMP2436]
MFKNGAKDIRGNCSRLPTGAIAQLLANAAGRGSLASVSQLLAGGADADGITPSGSRPLHLSAAGGHRAIVQLLLDAGADVQALDGEGRTPVQLAMAGSYITIAEMLVAHGAERRLLPSPRPQSLLSPALAEAAAARRWAREQPGRGRGGSERDERQWAGAPDLNSRGQLLSPSTGQARTLGLQAFQQGGGASHRQALSPSPPPSSQEEYVVDTAANFEAAATAAAIAANMEAAAAAAVAAAPKAEAAEEQEGPWFDMTVEAVSDEQ